jgi:hypothetical protein
VTPAQLALLLAVAKAVAAGFDTPFKDSRIIRELMATVKAENDAP